MADATVVSTNVNDIGTQNAGNYIYDAIGQLTHNTSENLYYFYNTQGLVIEVKSGTNTMVKFFYNERGQRIRKDSYSGGSLQNTTYYALDLSGNTMAVYSKAVSGSIAQTDLPIYGLSRLGVYSKADNSSNYEITDHLGNVRAVVKKISGNPVMQAYADNYPFGEQLPGRNSLSNYRYAFQGQELDGETGMEAFQLRLWDGRIGRWLSPDPYGQYASPYLGMGNNPIGMVDKDGGIAFNVGAAAVGALIGGGISAITQYQQTGKVDLWRVGTAAVFGGLAGFSLNPVGIISAGSGGDLADQLIEHRGDISKVNVTKSIASGAVAYATFGATKVLTSKTTSGLVYGIIDKATQRTHHIYGRAITQSFLSPTKIFNATKMTLNAYDKGIAIGAGFIGANKTFSDSFNNDVVKDYMKNTFNFNQKSFFNNMIFNDYSRNGYKISLGNLEMLNVSE